MMDQLEETAALESEESLLYSARHGEVAVVKALLEAKRDGKLTLDINCKGKFSKLRFLIVWRLFYTPQN